MKLKKKHPLGAPLLHYPPEVAIVTQPRDGLECSLLFYIYTEHLASKPDKVFIDLIL